MLANIIADTSVYTGEILERENLSKKRFLNAAMKEWPLAGAAFLHWLQERHYAIFHKSIADVVSFCILPLQCQVGMLFMFFRDQGHNFISNQDVFDENVQLKIICHSFAVMEAELSSDEQTEFWKCISCGCTMNNACVHPDQAVSNCHWVGKNICSHCVYYPGESFRYQAGLKTDV